MIDLLAWQDIQLRLREIFPEGTPNRAQSIWDIAARTVFVMLYVDAVEGKGVWLRPDQVTRMTDAQAAKESPADRAMWEKDSVRPSKSDIPGRWYAVNTRESIRDDTIRNALVANGAVIERQGLPTTSPAGKYALQDGFAALFAPELMGEELSAAIAEWQGKHLTAGARMRIAVMRKGASAGGDRILVTFPSGETQRMAPGPSSELSKAVIEIFAPKFLTEPAVIFLSESRDKVVSRHEELAKQIGLNILADRNLPDIILADLAPAHPRLVFIEVVASDGPVSETRKEALLKLTDAAGFPREHIAFVTAYFDRSRAQFKKTVDALAWGSFAWFASEPEHLLHFDGDGELVWKAK
ncbi:BsuBI/PstI family type II restriction endonuclease [Sinorhizobium sp. 8-89]|uniref:BsuBI/PstI family type II restriction endonuclease n=1 Tax=Sinorhizobium sp. 7-81 TaxID=3049087 RepID=UPI0024C292C0|nr:BsuBI/PstI family type II restriction endonuclease [Sinorhizobium sp. 7-81]MDK1389605.1 BsuBI/PstI family type II restriction endonuclease [Sinorhizobium sp. 7-81]